MQYNSVLKVTLDQQLYRPDGIVIFLSRLYSKNVSVILSISSCS